MKKKNINIWQDDLTKKNFEDYFAEAVALYNKGEYEAALIGFAKISCFDESLRGNLIPHIEKCKDIKNIKLSDIDKLHIKNQAVLHHFGWINNVKVFTGATTIILFLLVSNMADDDSSLLRSLSHHLGYVITATAFAIATYLLQSFMRKFNCSRGLIRCKYCGHYTQYINPNESTYGYTDYNNCSNCHRMYPVPDFYWDSWEGLEYMENRRSVPDKKFYIKYKELKERFSTEYIAWKNARNKSQP